MVHAELGNPGLPCVLKAPEIGRRGNAPVVIAVDRDRRAGVAGYRGDRTTLVAEQEAAVRRAAAFVPDDRIVDPRPVDTETSSAQAPQRNSPPAPLVLLYCRQADVCDSADQRVAVIEEARRRLAAIGGADHRE